MQLAVVVTALLIRTSWACLAAAPRQSAAPQYYYSQQAAPQVAVPARAAAAGTVNQNNGAITSSSLVEYLFGRNVRLSEFSSNGYNIEGGGPVDSGAALRCDFEGQSCCWANVPSPEDQIDWQLATGVPETARFSNVNIPGSYLVAYAAGAGPSDEAQFVSCSIACASSQIRVRATHWQSENVLLQVCQRESFPTSVNFNPLLNCQEFPATQGVSTTELVLPKASLVDIVFVASNFVGENGDIAVLDNIELIYETDTSECANPAVSAANLGARNVGSSVDLSKTISEVQGGGNSLSAVDGGISHTGEEGGFRGNGFSAAKGAKTITSGKFGSESGASGASIDAAGTGSSNSNATFNIKKTGESRGSIDVTPEMQACEYTKCNFEDGTACHYLDAYQTQSIRGLTTRFQIVTGQFMNRVTGVHEVSEGSYYAATYLYPREVAGLQAEVGYLPEDRRLRFQYYEGTHGVQLKGCCDSAENCPFSSDKFVTVSDRMWKYGSFACPKGTEKFIFLCENTRTNQGACGLDDIQVVENRLDVTASSEPLC